MKNISFFIVTFILMFSCESDEFQPEKTFEQIYQQFHGKYEIISSVSDRPLDINMDGDSSTDLLQEIPNLERSELVLLIRKRKVTSQQISSYLFSQYWPEQHFSYDTSTIYYPVQLVARFFTLNESRDILNIIHNEEFDTDLEKYPIPEKVIVNDEGQIQVTVLKKLFTSNGWQTIRIKTIYSRYTMNT